MTFTDDLIARGLAATDAELGIISRAIYRVYVRDNAYRRLGLLEDFKSLDLVLRFNGTGSFHLETSTDSPEGRYLTRTGGIIVTREVGGVETTIFSGSVATELEKTVRSLTVSGVDDNALLEEPARPTPSQASGPYPDDYHYLAGVASTVLREIVNNNIGPLAPVGCRIAALSLGTDPLLGGIVVFRGNFQPLIVAMKELAVTPAAGDLGFRILQSDTVANTVELRTFAPQDRTADAKFSVDLGTAQDYRDTWQLPDANYWVVMGSDGFGASNRTIVEGGDAALIAEAGRRITGVYVAPGVTDPGELNQKLAELLAGSTTTRKTTITPFDVPSLEFGVDWDFGDAVTVVVDGEATAEIIREVEINITDQGARVTPMIGDAGSSDDDDSARQLRTLRDRQANWELNWRVPDDSIIRAMLATYLRPPIGRVEFLAGPNVPAGYVAANGQSLLRSAYPLLFAEIGTTWGAADGLHFTVPDLRDRSPIGSGTTYSLGQLVGAASASISGLAHTHPGSHSHGTVSHSHSGGAHTHPGSHSHGLDAHRHQMGHDHAVAHVHDHGGITSGPSSNTVRQTGGGLNVATDFHWHDIASNSMSVTSSNSNNTVTGDGEKTSGGGAFTSTQGDSNAPSASYSGNTGSAAPDTQSDSNAPAASYSGSGSISIVHPSAALLPVIYAGE